MEIERRSGSRGSRMGVDVLVPPQASAELGMRRRGRPQARSDQVLRHGLEVEGIQVEPGRIMEPALEEKVGIVALGDVGVLVDERVIE